VYIYSQIKCDMHPDEPGAKEYYESTFGKLFRKAPKLKGIIFVGETFEFPSKDPHTSGIRHQLKPADDPRPSPGWYPCADYPSLVNLVRDTIRQYNPQVDIVFWSYNWGWAPKQARLALIEALPRDISLLVTFEMWEYLTDDRGDTYKIADYSISFPGPAQVFMDEAQKAKELGVRLYTMCNTGGRTWDIGTAPYLPVPQQWQKRYEALRAAKEQYGLCGLMENHHYGWMPSFLSLFAKNAFTGNPMPDAQMLGAIARRDFGEAYALAMDAWAQFSEGISHVVACELDQYGPYRCGPSYPLTFTQKPEDLIIPFVPWAWHKQAEIWTPIYGDTVVDDPGNTLMRLRHIDTVTAHFQTGVARLAQAVEACRAPKGSEPSLQLAVARYILCNYRTARNVMRWNTAKRLLFALREKKTAFSWQPLLDFLRIPAYTEQALAEFLKSVAGEETENVAVALQCWQEDSRLGFEASMEYAFDADFAGWKLAVTKESLELLDAYLQAGL